MEDLPEEYTQHNLPLVLLSGLGLGDGVLQDPNAKQSNGTRLLINTPECVGEKVPQLLDQFVKRDGRFSAWNAGTLPGPGGFIRYHMKPIGRVNMPSYWGIVNDSNID
jgi:hypothetical protein